MASLEQWLYAFARKQAVPNLGLTGETKTVGGTAVSVLLLDSAGKVLFCKGTSVPTDSGAGYAKGCIFIKTDAGAGTGGIYFNVGTITACNFDLAGDFSVLSLAEGNVYIGNAAGAAAALNAKGDGKILIGNGTTATSAAMTGDVTIINDGTTTIGANKITSAKVAVGVIQVDTVVLAKTDIVHATPIKTIVAAAGAGYYNQFINASITFKYSTAAYTGGGNISFAYAGGGATLTGIVSAANSFGAGADWVYDFPKLSTAGILIPKETAITLVTSGTFTDPGTAAGTAEVNIAYRVLPIET